jgi:hypothetical protein
MVGKPKAEPDVTENASRGEHAVGGAFWFASGAVLGVVVLVGDAMIDWAAIAATQKILFRDVCLDGFTNATVVAMFVIAVLSSVFVGAWIFSLRRWVGFRPAPGEEAWSELIRARFTWGSFGVFVAGTPVKWLLVLLAANCGHGA